MQRRRLDVRGTLAQRRQSDRDDVQPIEQILPEWQIADFIEKQGSAVGGLEPSLTGDLNRGPAGRDPCQEVHDRLPRLVDEQMPGSERIA
jgi:hypothetical protein